MCISTAGNTSKPAATNSKVEAPKSVFNFSNPIAPTTSTPEIKSEASKGVNLTATLWLSKPAAVEPAASEEEFVNPAAAVEEEEPAPAAEEEAPAPPSPVREASDGTAVPEAYDAQVKCLVSFYAVHDSGKGESDCKAILDKRLAGGTGGLSTLKFSKLCSAMQKKYGVNPLDGAKPKAAAAAPEPEAKAPTPAPKAEAAKAPEPEPVASGWAAMQAKQVRLRTFVPVNSG